MFARIARIVAVSLPLLLVVVLVSAAYWRTHRAAAVSDVVSTPAAAPDPSAGQLDQTTLLHHLSISVPWPALIGLVILCVLPAMASMAAWSGARRSRESRFSTFSG